jgi:hypothetical protein
VLSTPGWLDPTLMVVDSDAGATRSETPTPRRSPLKFFHAVVFVLGGGLAAVWSRWGLLLVAVGVVVAFVLLKAKASTLDMNQERHRIAQLRDDLSWVRNSVEHPDGSAYERLRMLEVLRRYGRLSPADYQTQRDEIVRGPGDQTGPNDGSDPVS